MPSAAIYHFTDKSEKRPIVCQKVLDQLTQYADSMGYTVKAIYCDYALTRKNRPEFDKFLSHADRYDALFVKDLRHISGTTIKCLKEIRHLEDSGLHVFTLLRGMFQLEVAPFSSPLRAASYVCRSDTLKKSNEVLNLQNKTFQLFVKEKTSWKLTRQYQDESLYQRKGEQTSLEDLIRNSDAYDIILVRSTGELHWRTNEFSHIRDKLNLPIYSLQEGYIPYKKVIV